MPVPAALPDADAFYVTRSPGHDRQVRAARLQAEEGATQTTVAEQVPMPIPTRSGRRSRPCSAAGMAKSRTNNSHALPVQLGGERTGECGSIQTAKAAYGKGLY
jgi:hypothetical protein